MKTSLAYSLVASAMILAGGAISASAQTPAAPATPAPAAAMPAAPAAPATPAAAAPAATPAMPAAPEKVAAVAKPHLSACARAIRASERKLDKSTADSQAIATAWQHIEEAKKAKGAECQEHAKQAAAML